MRKFVMGVGCTLVLVAIGCSDQATGPKTPARTFAPELSRGSDDAVKQEGIAGAADFTFVDALGRSFDEHFENEAHRRKNGSIDGEFDWKQRGKSISDFDAHFGGEIVCFAIDGHDVRVSARIERSNSSSLPPGTYVIWAWRDNDDAGKKAPDTMTNFFVVPQDAAARHCTLGTVLVGTATYPANHGKLEILHDDH